MDAVSIQVYQYVQKIFHNKIKDVKKNKEEKKGIKKKLEVMNLYFKKKYKILEVYQIHRSYYNTESMEMYTSCP